MPLGALGIVERGNEDDDLHALVSALTGKDSVKSLTYTEAQAVIADLQKRQGAAPLPRHKPKTHPERPGGPQTASSERCGRSCISWPRRIRSPARLPGGAAVRHHPQGAEGGLHPPAALYLAGLPGLQQADRGAEGVCEQRKARWWARMSALDRVQMSDLDEEQQQVAELIGLDNYKRLVSVFGGLSIYIPKAGRLGADGPR